MLCISRLHQLRQILIQIHHSTSYPVAWYSNEVNHQPLPSKNSSSSSQVTQETNKTITIRRQKAGVDKPVFSSPEDYIAKAASWKAQLPHEDDPAALTYPPRPIDPNAQDWLSPDYLIRMTKKPDLSPQGMRDWLKLYFWRTDVKKQQFNPTRHGILGPDLATAHFITYRGGRIKFVGHTEWWADDSKLPGAYEEEWIIEKIDASATGLVGEGITNLSNLYSLTDLNLSNNSQLDVFAFDKLYRQFRFSTCLKHLNLTGCTDFCENSLAAIHRLPSLEEVIITNTRASQYKFLELIVIMLHDINPNLKVIM